MAEPYSRAIRPLVMPEPSATILLSGGIDSAACLKLLQTQGFSVRALFVDYGQAALEREARAAAAVAKFSECPFDTARIAGFDPFGSGELLGRNSLLIFLAAFLRRGDPGVVAIGIHAGTSYYDCSESFIELTRKLIAEQSDGLITVAAPFLSWTKHDVFTYFQTTGIPLALTYSCENGLASGCGDCLSCRDRMGLEC